MRSLRVLGKRVVVRRARARSQSAGGIYLPDKAQKSSKTGIVLEVGPDFEGELAVGDLVAFGQYAGTETELSDEQEKVLIMHDNEILGVIEEGWRNDEWSLTRKPQTSL